MRRALWLFIRVVCTAGFLSACASLQTAETPVSTTMLTQAPAGYSVWWAEVQTCAGMPLVALERSVISHVVVVDAPTIRYNGKDLAAFFTGEELWVAKPYLNDRAAVAHEMMHAALYMKTGHPVGHLNQYFGPGNACRLTVTYSSR